MENEKWKIKIEKPNFSSSLVPKAISVRSTFSGSKSPLAIISLQLTTRITSYCFAIQECLIYECFPRYWVYFSKELFSVISNAIRCSVTCFGVVSSHEAVPLFVVLPPPLFPSIRQTKSNNLRGRKSKPRRLLVVYGMLNTSGGSCIWARLVTCSNAGS